MSPAAEEFLRTLCGDVAARIAAAATSQHVGQVGERLERALTVTRIASFNRPRFGAPYLHETVQITSMTDAAGNVYVIKSPTFGPAVGAAFTLRATVKDHSEYKGCKQTVLQRPSVKKESAA